ncbi:MAG: hypothetical protein JSS07_08700 [Proteobacteria bacterium]|nr:hypothetical protein [Pseudomonadota bacterium]
MSLAGPKLVQVALSTVFVATNALLWKYSIQCNASKPRCVEGVPLLAGSLCTKYEETPYRDKNKPG